MHCSITVKDMPSSVALAITSVLRRREVDVVASFFQLHATHFSNVRGSNVSR